MDRKVAIENGVRRAQDHIKLLCPADIRTILESVRYDRLIAVYEAAKEFLDVHVQTDIDGFKPYLKLTEAVKEVSI